MENDITGINADAIRNRIDLIEEKVETACRNSGRKRQEIKLMGVTKMYPVEAVEAAFNAGISIFGENRVKEGVEKFSKFYEKHPKDGGIELHLIGNLQRNKAKSAVSFFDCIQSVDRDSIISELGILTSQRKEPLNILLELHTGEDSKAGFPDVESLFWAAEKVLSFKGLTPLGLMTMAPFTGDKAAIRSSFRKLAAARCELVKRFSVGMGRWSCLSMGMTNDFQIAIEEGSTLIRLGTAIFKEGGA
jgi:pyridoxal phosphate enzyme (YggS family)